MRVILHLGAYKTASTHIQRRLDLNAETLAQAGVAVATPATLRPALRRAEVGAGPAIAEAVRDAGLLGMARIVVSEEQLPGPLRPMAQGQAFYRGAERRLAPIAEALAGQEVTVLLALRSYADFYASAYGQVIRGWRWIDFGTDERERILAESRGWPDLVADIYRAFPGRPVHVWRYEAMGRRPRPIWSALLGRDRLSALARRPGRTLRRPSQAAIERLRAFAATRGELSAAEVRQVTSALPSGPGCPAFDPWSKSERDVLDARYRADLDRITQRWPGIFLDRPASQSGVSIYPAPRTVCR